MNHVEARYVSLSWLATLHCLLPRMPMEAIFFYIIPPPPPPPGGAIVSDPAAGLTTSRHVACKKLDLPESTKLM